jgi:hypothetical protein
MSKPASRPEELGRAIGYQVDARLLLEQLTREGTIDLQNARLSLQELERAARVHEGSRPRKPPKRLWVVVKIERGVPVLIDAYRDKRSANRRADFLRLHMRADVDRVELFAIELESTA